MIPMTTKLVTNARYDGQMCQSSWPSRLPATEWTPTSRMSSVAAIAKMPSLNVSRRVVSSIGIKLTHAVDGGRRDLDCGGRARRHLDGLRLVRPARVLH